MKPIKIIPEFALEGTAFIVKDEAQLVEFVAKALEMSPTGRAVVEEIVADDGPITPDEKQDRFDRHR